MWTVSLHGGPCRVNHAAARVGHYIYSFGGYSTEDELKDWDPIKVFILNTKTYRWSPGPLYTLSTAPYHRYGHSVVSLGEKIYLWGGRNNSQGFYTVSCFDTTTLTWKNLKTTGTEPLAKDGHSACIINNKMYIFGGFEFLTDQYSQDTHCLDLNTLEWSLIRAKGQIPSQRDFHTAVPIGHCMYVFGGRGGAESDYGFESYCQNVYIFDTKTETWECLDARGNIPEGRRSHSAWYYKDYMYIFGGYNGTTKRHFNDIYRFSPKYDVWEKLKVRGKCPSERRRQCCIMYEDKMYLFGGTSPHPVDGISYRDEKTKDNDDLYVLDLNVSLRTLCILKVVSNNFDISCLPSNVRLDINSMTLRNTISRGIEYNYKEDDTED